MMRSKKWRRQLARTLSSHPKLQFPFSFIYSKTCLVRALFRNEPVGSEFSRFLFIVSCGRSGTTLLRRLLTEKHLIYIPPESYVFADLVKSFMTSGALDWCDRVAMALGRFEYHPEFETFGSVDMAEVYRNAIRLPRSERRLGEVVKILYDKVAQEKGIEYQWLGDKTPSNTFNLGLMRKMFPRACFLHIVRDPADVIDSIVRMGRHGGAKEAAERWRDSVCAWREFQRMMPSELVLEVRYEDLVRDIPGTLDKVAGSFGVPGRKSEIPAGEFLGDVNMRDHHSRVLEPVGAGHTGKGRARLSEEQKRIVGPIVNDLAELYGYDRL